MVMENGNIPDYTKIQEMKRKYKVNNQNKTRTHLFREHLVGPIWAIKLLHTGDYIFSFSILEAVNCELHPVK